MLEKIARLLSCREITRLNSERLDRPLTPRERFLARVHVLYCASCRNVQAQFAFLRQAMLAYRAGSSVGEKNRPPE